MENSLEANTCQEKLIGINYGDSAAAGIVRQNVCIANEAFGISVGDQAHPTLAANTCSGNGEDDIYVTPTARPILKDNRLQGNQCREVKARDQELQWEYCEMRQEAVIGGVTGVLFSLMNQYTYRLEAIATGPRGRYHVAYSPRFSTPADVSMGGGSGHGEPALAALTAELVQDGWEPLPGGPLWWQARFRRPVRM